MLVISAFFQIHLVIETAHQLVLVCSGQQRRADVVHEAACGRALDRRHKMGLIRNQVQHLIRYCHVLLAAFRHAASNEAPHVLEAGRQELLELLRH